MEEEKRNVLIFFAISVLIMIGYPYFFQKPKQPISQQIDKIVYNTSGNQQYSSKNSVVVQKNRELSKLHQTKIENIHLESSNLSGVISSRGAKIDNIFLKKYKKDSEKDNNEKVSIFGDISSNYFAQTEWVSDDPSIILPDDDTCWEAKSTKLTENSHVLLSWDNQNGLFFEKLISVDENFVITIENKVKNYGNQPVALKAKMRINREFEKKSDDAWTFYNGPLGYINGRLEEISYEDIVKKGDISHQTQGGWFGITDKYWLVAFISEQKTNHKLSYKHFSGGNKNIYKIESIENMVYVAPSEEVTKTHRLFVGAKEIKTLDMYEKKLGIEHFDLAIDFGWLYFLTKPLLYSLVYIKDLIGNMGFGILLLTLLLKLLLFPLANRSYRSMNRLKEIQPKVQALQKRYADDKVKLGQEVSALYKKEGVNPVGGCLPTLLQSPVLFALYKVLYISIEMRQAPFILWIHDLSLPDPMTILNLFGLIQVNLPGFLQIGILPLLMGLSMYWQQKIGPAPTDPAQASMTLIMPIMFTFMFAQLPSGLVLYWTFSNILAIGQQYLITKMDENNQKREKTEKWKH